MKDLTSYVKENNSDVVELEAFKKLATTLTGIEEVECENVSDVVKFISDNHKSIKIVFKTTEGNDITNGLSLYGNKIYNDTEVTIAHINLMTTHNIEKDSNYQSGYIYIQGEDYDSEINAFLLGELIDTKYVFSEQNQKIFCVFFTDPNKFYMYFAHLLIVENKIYFQPTGLNEENYKGIIGAIEIHFTDDIVILNKRI